MAVADDASTNVAELRAKVAAFVRERDWEKFHAPKNLAMALACEAAELMEEYLWMEAAESRAATATDGAEGAERRARVEAEVADVAFCLLNLCNVVGIDLAGAMERKLAEAAAKYPAEQVRGKAKKYDEY
jgi:NTP pyrophosphatase (non-canonical NTP hydrolase)